MKAFRLMGPRPKSSIFAGLWLLALAAGFAPFQALAQAEPSSPPAGDDAWPVAELADNGFDAAAMAALTLDLRTGRYDNTHAVLVEKDGALVFELYLSGRDEKWGEPQGFVTFDRESLHDLRSVTKSVTTLLLGIALAQHHQGGFQDALETPLPQFFPDLKEQMNPEMAQVTLHHVLTMTAGLEWNEMEVPYTNPENDEIQLYFVADPVAMVLARPLVQAPGEGWYYNGGLTQVVAGVIERLTGKPLDLYAEEVLFEPLGITDYEWFASPAWGEGSSPSAASALRLRARDLAKIGSVMAHGGSWQGQEIAPPEWIELATTRYVPTIPWSPSGTFGYGYMWYPGELPGAAGDGGPLRIVRAAGNGDQRLFILPDLGLVITHYAGNYNNYQLRNSEDIARHILGAYLKGGN